MAETRTGGITPSQLKAIYGMARRAGMTDGDVHALAMNMTGCESMRQLDGWQAGRIINELKKRLGQPVSHAPDGNAACGQQPPDRASERQQRMIYALAREMGWLEENGSMRADGKRLRGWLEKRYGVSDVRFLNSRQAGACIDAMKAMQREGRQERKARAGESAAPASAD